MVRRGVLLGAAAYASWGASALYWPLLRPASAAEILAIRIISSFAVLLLVVVWLRRWPRLRPLLRTPRQLRLLSLASLLVAVNWGTFIFATTHGRVIEASLGYFISPLVMVALAALGFRERPRPRQWLAASLGGGGVVVLVLARTTGFPWIALTLAVTFGLYAAIKKRAGVGTVESLTVETAVLLVPAIAYALALQVTGDASFGHVSVAHTGLMVGASAVMVTPLLLFGAAANRAPLTTLGLLQYVEPVVQFLIGLLVFSEPMPGPRWIAFGLVWVAVAVIIADGREAARGGSRRAVNGAELGR